MMKILKEFKEYIGNFTYDLIIASEQRITVINQNKGQYIEINDSIMVIDILEYLISHKVSLTDIFECCNIYFSTSDYLNHYLQDYTKVV